MPAETGEPVFAYSRLGASVRVFANRIEAESGTLFKKKETVSLRNVASVEKTVTGKLVVTTNDGKRHEWLIGPRADEARQAVLEHL